MGLADTANLVAKLSLEGNFTSELSKAEAGLNRFGSSVGKIGTKIGNDLGKGIRTSAQNLERLAVVAGGAFVAGIGAAVKVAGDFEAQLNTIGTIVDRGELAGIGEQLRATARATGLGLEDLTSAYYDLASAGVKGALATAALNDAVTLGIGGLATTGETVDLLTTAINAYGLDIKGAAVATDQFALAVADGKVKASEIAASFADVASIAKAYGVGIDQIAASYAFLTAQGVPATEVTTEMNRALVSLINPSTELAAAAKALGVDFGEEIKNKGLVAALQEIRTYSDKTGIPLNALLGRIEAVKYVLQTTGPSFVGYNAELAKMGNAAGTAAAQMAERQQGLNFQLARLKANVIDAGITIGSALIPQLANLAEDLTKFLTGHQREIQQFAENLATGFRDAVTWAKKLDWAAIGNGVKTAATFAKSLIDAFTNLPPQVKETLAGLYALNKLSGGAVVNIGIDLTKGAGGALFQQFLGRGSPANPMFVIMEGGTGGLPSPTNGLVDAVKYGLKLALAPALFFEAGEAFRKGAEQVTGSPDSRAAFNDFQKNASPGFGDRFVQWVQGLFGAKPPDSPTLGPPKPATPIGRNPDHLIVSAPDLTAEQRENNRILRQTGQVAASNLAVGLSEIARSIATFGYSPAEWQSIYERAYAAGGRSLINALDRTHKSTDAIALADTETSKFLTGTAGPFFRDGKNQTRLLKSLSDAQAYFKAHGDTATAAKLGHDIDLLKAKIKPPIVNVYVPVTVTVRDYQRQQNIVVRYGRSLVD